MFTKSNLLILIVAPALLIAGCGDSAKNVETQTGAKMTTAVSSPTAVASTADEGVTSEAVKELAATDDVQKCVSEVTHKTFNYIGLVQKSFAREACSTGCLSFDTTEAMCEGLKNEQMNNGCGWIKRGEMFKQSCVVAENSQVQAEATTSGRAVRQSHRLETGRGQIAVEDFPLMAPKELFDDGAEIFVNGMHLQTHP